MEFEEFPNAESRGSRIAVNRPDGQIEFVQVLDPIKAAAHYKTSLEEGIFKLFLTVNDEDEAIADAERKGVPIDLDRITEGKVSDFLHFKHLWFNEEKNPYEWLGLISRPE